MKLMEKIHVYLRMKRRLTVPLYNEIQVRDIAHVSAKEDWKKKIEKTVLYKASKSDHTYIVIDCFQVIDGLQKLFPRIECQHLGPVETIVHIEEAKQKASFFRISIVW